MFEDDYRYKMDGSVCRVYLILSILSWGHTIAVTKNTVKGALALKTGIETHIRDGLIGIFQKGTCIIQPDCVQILVKITVKGSGKDSGQHIRTASQVVGHFGQADFFLIVSCDIGNGLIDDILASNRTFFHKREAGHTSSQDDLKKCLMEYQGMGGGGFVLEPVYGINDIRMKLFLGNHRVRGTILLQRRQKSPAKRRRAHQIYGCAFSRAEDLIMMDQIGKHKGKITGFHMEEFLANADLQSALGHIDALQGFMKVRLDMTRFLAMYFYGIFDFFVKWQHFLNLHARFGYFLFGFGKNYKWKDVIMQL